MESTQLTHPENEKDMTIGFYFCSYTCVNSFILANLCITFLSDLDSAHLKVPLALPNVTKNYVNQKIKQVMQHTTMQNMQTNNSIVIILIF